MSRGRVFAGCAAFVWVTIAIVIAIPAEIVNFRWTEASVKFLVNLHGMFICALIAVDVWIGAYLLQDRRISIMVRQNGIKIISVLALFAIVCGVYWRANPGSFWENVAILVGLACVGIWLVRYWTYHVNIDAEPFGGPTFSPVGSEGSGPAPGES